MKTLEMLENLLNLLKFYLKKNVEKYFFVDFLAFQLK